KIIEQIKYLLQEEATNCSAPSIIIQKIITLSNKEDNTAEVHLVLLINNHHEEKNNNTTAATNYTNEATLYSDYEDLHIIIYGPGDAKLAHQANEYVSIENYINSIHYYSLMAQSYTKSII